MKEKNIYTAPTLQMLSMEDMYTGDPIVSSPGQTGTGAGGEIERETEEIVP